MFVLMSFSYLLFSADTGIITGRIMDSETGKPLIGADVFLWALNWVPQLT